MLGAVLLTLLAGALPFTDKAWELSGDAAVETFDGRPTLRIDTGQALRRDVKLLDGTIDFDVQLTRRRSFVYLTFRMQDEKNHEEIYLRPHKSELPDAVQYAPVWNGSSAWQLHYGPGGTAAIPFEPGVWTPVRLVLQGRRAALYVGDLTKPAMVMPRLAREPQAGFIGLKAFVPPGTPGRGTIARYSNLRVSTTPAVDLSKVAMEEPAEEKRRVRAWAISDAMTWSLGDGVPAAPVPTALRVVEAEPTGLVELHRYVAPPEGAREVTAAARIHVTAAAAGSRAFELGFSDRASVFVNGVPLFSGEGRYDYEKRRDGLIGFEQARLYLPLKSGDNEVLVVLWDTFGGMGLMGRFPDASGLTVEAR